MTLKSTDLGDEIFEERLREICQQAIDTFRRPNLVVRLGLVIDDPWRP